jgi:hypothetical protein
MGYGEIGGGGSVYWTMVHENLAMVGKSKSRAKTRRPNDAPGALDDEIKGRDPIPFDAIGVKGGHKGKFRVTLRFDTKAQAVAAALRLGKIEKVNEKYVLVIDVPAIKRPSPDVDPPAEVQVEW